MALRERDPRTHQVPSLEHASLVDGPAYGRFIAASVVGECLELRNTTQERSVHCTRGSTDAFICVAPQSYHHEARLKGVRNSTASLGSIVRTYQSTNWTTPPS